MNHHISVFRKNEAGYWQWVRNTTLAELYNVTFGKNWFQQTLLDDDAIGSCHIKIASMTKKEVDILMDNTPDLMLREIDRGRLDDWRNGKLILEVRMKNTPRIDANMDDDYPWKFSVNVNILRWEGRNE